MSIRPYPIIGAFVALTIVVLGAIVIERIPTFAVGDPDVASVPAAPSPSDVVTFDVRQGDAADVIATRLKQAGVIESPEAFTELTSLEGLQNGLAAGQYQFSRGMPAAEVIARLHAGNTGALRVTIPEGKRVEEVGQILEKAGVVPAQAFLNALQQGHFNYDFLKDDPQGAGLEGYIFPDTYNFPLHNNPDDVVNAMLKDFGQRLTPALRTALQQEGLSIHDAVTLASIVEREAQQPSERPTIASVFLNRMRAGMPLQADPTVQYALAADSKSLSAFGYWKRELTLDDLTVKSPYNTYVRPGLPPGPIANPGLASIEAVAHPAQTKYYYFVAKNDGTHVFAETYAEHQANIAKYQH